ncbi:hypothetical protein quinque_014562 [Culex quinquefasciatus]
MHIFGTITHPNDGENLTRLTLQSGSVFERSPNQPQATKMNTKVLLQLGSLLMAIGLTSAKSLPEPTEPTEVVPVAPDQTALPVEEKTPEDVIQLSLAPWLKLKQLFVEIQDKVHTAAEKTKLKIKLATAKLGEDVKGLILDKFGKKKEVNEPEVVLVTLPPNGVYVHEEDQELNSVLQQY